MLACGETGDTTDIHCHLLALVQWDWEVGTKIIALNDKFTRTPLCPTDTCVLRDKKHTYCTTCVLCPLLCPLYHVPSDADIYLDAPYWKLHMPPTPPRTPNPKSKGIFGINVKFWIWEATNNLLTFFEHACPKMARVHQPWVKCGFSKLIYHHI